MIPSTRPIITLCGSTRFRKQFEEENARLSLEGNIVISLAMFGTDPSDDTHPTRRAAKEGNTPISAEAKIDLDNLHKAKIEVSDMIYVINVNGYVGDSTRSEIWYAEWRHKRIRWMNPPANDDFTARVRRIMDNPYIRLQHPHGLSAVDVMSYLEHDFPMCSAIDAADALKEIYG